MQFLQPLLPHWQQQQAPTEAKEEASSVVNAKKE